MGYLMTLSIAQII